MLKWALEAVGSGWVEIDVLEPDAPICATVRVGPHAFVHVELSAIGDETAESACTCEGLQPCAHTLAVMLAVQQALAEMAEASKEMTYVQGDIAQAPESLTLPQSAGEAPIATLRSGASAAARARANSEQRLPAPFEADLSNFSKLLALANPDQSGQAGAFKWLPVRVVLAPHDPSARAGMFPLHWELKPYKGKWRKNGEISRAWRLISYYGPLSQDLDPEQAVHLQPIRELQAQAYNSKLKGSLGAWLLKSSIENLDVRLLDTNGPRVVFGGAARAAQPAWHRQDDGRLLPILTDDAGRRLSVIEAMNLFGFVAPKPSRTRSAAADDIVEVFPLTLPLPHDIATRILSMRALEDESLANTAAQWEAAGWCAPPEPPVVHVLACKPVPVLRLGAMPPLFRQQHKPLPVLSLSMRYVAEVAGFDKELRPVVADEAEEIRHVHKGERFCIVRNPSFELDVLDALARTGWALNPLWHQAHMRDYLTAGRLSLVPASRTGALPPALMFEVDENACDIAAIPTFAESFFSEIVPRMRAAGWQIDIDKSWAFESLLVEEDALSVDLEGEEDSPWFTLELGVQIGGKTVSLIEPLLEALHKLPQGDATTLREAIDALPDSARLYTSLADGRRIGLPVKRVKPLLHTLRRLGQGRTKQPGPLKVHRAGGLELEELLACMEAAEGRSVGAQDLRRLVDSLQAPPAAPLPLPTNFGATLRPYQEQGRAFLSFLRGQRFGGILADDMGLGKTVQVLAHLAALEAAGELKTPALIVAPTSVVGNWQSEASRFAPQLRVLELQGKTRAEKFGAIEDAHLVLTSYALLTRDIDVLKAQRFSYLILDEAQAIKNPKAKVSNLVQLITAEYRLCLTGTPMENNLEDLWSIFNFLNPGLLGDVKSFRKNFRKPIEDDQCSDTRQRLARRLKPLLLRRTKAEVMLELPEKNLITRAVPLESKQRDLYETLRVAMLKKVREALKRKGIKQSRIVVLDALLKLRQVCCDPRLLPDHARPKSVPASSKFEHTLEMLETLVAEERRVLLFSQFTGMLALLEAAIAERKWSYLKLTGQTEKRSDVVRRFQEGHASVFLISLKAGGTGLNLTRADTVIHYDPWWNPAVEAQATDRAHRMGQTQSVDVYKLIAKGTVEERIVDLQARKASLAAALFDENADHSAAFTEADIEALLAPI